jgi:chemotaxis methyl-accepting protein methylase
MMTEVSLLEIKDFVTLAKEYGKNYSDFSIAALRLRIQRICREHLNMRFLDFIASLQSKGQFREDVFSCIGTHSRDLFRDASLLNDFASVESETLTKPEAKVLIIDYSNFSDSINFVLSTRMLELEVRAQVHVAGINICNSSKRVLKLSAKEMENATVNFSTAFPEKDINSLLRFTNADQQCALPDYVSFHKERMTGEPEFKFPEKYDILISINNSLVYNYNGQQKFLDSCLQAVEEGGRIFFGQRENFSTFLRFDEIQRPDKILPRYVKLRK